MASSTKDLVPAEEPTSTSATHAGTSTAAFTPDSSAFASGGATAVPSMADVAAYLENHEAQEPQQTYESQDQPPHTTTKRLRSPSLGSVADCTGSADRELSPRKLARLASGSRFDQNIDQNEAQSAQERERPHVFGNALPAAPVAEPNDQAAQRALSVLRDAEALLSQRTAEHNNTETNAAPLEASEPTAAAAAAAASTLAEAASNQLAATNAANAANAASAAAAVAAIAAAAAATQTQRENEAETTQDAQQLVTSAHQGPSTLRFPNESATASSTAVDTPPAPAAQMAMPELAPRSQAGSKRHKCPDCDTEFTRHHNLKSHLLTHSQEKPYACRGCDMSFRRLHDLKRHSKLHTGEKPHICPRCDRKFARGDALARHSKGAGGCAGRRSSSSAFGAGDQSFGGNSSMMDDSMMSGIEYGGADDPERRKLSLPSMKATLKSTTGHGRPYSHSLPPAAAAAAAATAVAAAAAAAERQRGASTSGSDLYPLSADRAPDAASAALSSIASSTLAASSAIGHTTDTSVPGSDAAVLSHQNVVESPKVTSANTGSLSQGRPELSQVQGQQVLARPMEGSSNGDTNANIFSSEQGMWAYIQTLEDKLKAQADRIKEQDEHIAHLEVARQTAEAQVEAVKQRIDTLFGPSGAASPVGDPAPTTTAS